jgi:tungstate transport system substrate-binding protein
VHFRFARRWLAGLLAAAVLLVAVGTYLSLPRSHLLMATTTSTRDTGLLPYLLPEFSADTGIQVRYIAVGTGQALDAGRRGDVDVVMVHAPRLEERFLAEGHGLCRNSIMYNRFVVVGPAADPARLRNATSAADAFLRIANASARFESRADGSGTNTKELDLWADAGLDPSTFGPWYERTEQGMGATLTIANERDAYTLTDDGTWYAREPGLPYLDLLFADDPVLENPYSVIPVSPSAHPGVHADQAVAFARWLVGARGQSLIGAFTVNGHAIFTPDGDGVC